MTSLARKLLDDLINMRNLNKKYANIFENKFHHQPANLIFEEMLNIIRFIGLYMPKPGWPLKIVIKTAAERNDLSVADPGAKGAMPPVKYM